MNFIETPLKDAYIIEPKILDDPRGFFYEGFWQRLFNEKTGMDFNIVQMNFSRSSKGVLRGLHFQKDPMAQAKLVSLTVGEVWDVIVDLRIGSATYGKWHGEILSSYNKRRFFVPQGFAHGFVSLTDTVELMYAVDNPYSKDHDSGIIYNDRSLRIDWKLPNDSLILSDKDMILPKMTELQ